jgi:hypothetical protein
MWRRYPWSYYFGVGHIGLRECGSSLQRFSVTLFGVTFGGSTPVSALGVGVGGVMEVSGAAVAVGGFGLLMKTVLGNEGLLMEVAGVVTFALGTAAIVAGAAWNVRAFQRTKRPERRAASDSG